MGILDKAKELGGKVNESITAFSSDEVIANTVIKAVGKQEKINEIPAQLKKYKLILGNDNMSLDYTYNAQDEQTGITNLLQELKDVGLKLRDLKTEQNSLEKIFVSLVRENNEV